MAKDLILEIETAVYKVQTNAQQEAFLAGVETGINAGYTYILNGFKNSSFIPVYLSSNIQAILEGSNSYPYGQATDGTSLRWALGAGFGSLFPENKLVRPQFLEHSELTKLSYLQGLLVAFSTMFEINNDLVSISAPRKQKVLCDYMRRIQLFIKNIEL